MTILTYTRTRMRVDQFRNEHYLHKEQQDQELIALAHKLCMRTECACFSSFLLLVTWHSRLLLLSLHHRRFVSVLKSLLFLHLPFLFLFFVRSFGLLLVRSIVHVHTLTHKCTQAFDFAKFPNWEAPMRAPTHLSRVKTQSEHYIVEAIHLAHSVD